MIRFAALAGPFDNPSDGDSLVLFTSYQKAKEHIARVYSNYQEYARVAVVEIKVLDAEPPIKGEL